MVMEETKKRARDQSDVGVVSSSETSNGVLTELKRPRVYDMEEYSSSPESRQFEETIFDILDEPAEVDTTVQGLESVIRSFEEEILAAPADQPADLGYLFGASDDELGLPPTSAYSSGDEWGFGVAGWPEDTADFELGRIFGFENEFVGYCQYGFEAGSDGYVSGYGDGEFVTVDGLFNYAGAGSEWAEV